MKKVLLIILLIILLTIFPFYQLFALNNIEVQNFKMNSFGMNSKLLFTVEGSGELSNPSAIPVTIKEIEYVGLIKNQVVFEGAIPGMRIPAGEKKEFPFEEEIDWVPDAATVEEILAGKNVTLVIHTEARASYLYFFTVKGEKEVQLPLTKLVKPYVEEQMAKITNTLAALLG